MIFTVTFTKIAIHFLGRFKKSENYASLPPPLYLHKALSQICWRFFPFFLVSLTTLFFSISTRAQETAQQRPIPPGLPPASGNTDIVKRIDPTDFKNRFDLRYEFNQYATASHQLIVPRFEYAFSKSLAIRTELPIARYDLTDGGASSGIGNLLVRVGWRAIRDVDYALVVGTDLTFDTASNPTLGSGKHVLAPFAFVAFELPQVKSQFFSYVQHGKAVGGDMNRQDVDYTNIRGSLLSRLPDKVYTFVEYSYWIDHHNSNVTSSQIKFEAGKFFLPKTGFYIRPGAGLSGTEKQFGSRWSLELGMRHFF